MADKKKKVLFTKEAVTRRPMILKSDREVVKEQKDKQEKEKQPTIILKCREQSASKEERPQSPKTQSAEGDGYHPQKIAQNENKDKKIVESKPVPSLKLMTKPVKLLDENLEFSQSALKYLQDCNTNYSVVGIIGPQGVGKSMILNLIAQNTPISDLCTQILNSHEIPNNTSEGNDVASIENQMENLNLTNVTTPSEVQSTNNFFKFKMQDIEQIERGAHCTKGVDMYVTNDRVILLDCQPLWSPSLIDESNSISMNPRCANIVTVDCLEIASFLMSICHVLIAVQDWFTDYNFLRYIQTAEMLKPTLSASSSVSAPTEGSESSGDGEWQPHLLMLHNRCQLQDFTPDNVKIMQDLYRKVFQKSTLQLNSGIYMYSDDRNGLHVDHVCKGYNVDNCGPPINMFLLPEIYSDFDNKDIYRGHPTFEQLAKRLRWLVLGANRHQITNVPNLSEKGWFQYCNKAWEIIRKCTFFIEYERLLP